MKPLLPMDTSEIFAFLAAGVFIAFGLMIMVTAVTSFIFRNMVR